MLGLELCDILKEVSNRSVCLRMFETLSHVSIVVEVSCCLLSLRQSGERVQDSRGESALAKGLTSARQSSCSFSISHHIDRKQPNCLGHAYRSCLSFRPHIMAAPQTSQAVRRWIMTAAVAGITVTGTFYGAGLKTERETKQVRSYPTIFHHISNNKYFIYSILRMQSRLITNFPLGAQTLPTSLT